MRLGFTLVVGMPLANAVMAACMVAAFAAQFDQQWWNSVARRTTKRDCAGLMRLIFGCASAYASSTLELAKYGDCGVSALSEWQREQYGTSSGCQMSAPNCADEVGKVLLGPTSCSGGATSWICCEPVAVLPAQ